jgi:hypothetical protein
MRWCFRAETNDAVILRSCALARRLEGWPQVRVPHPSRLAVKNGEHLRMTLACVAFAGTTTHIFRARFNRSSCAAISAGSVTGYEQNVLVQANAAGPSG